MKTKNNIKDIETKLIKTVQYMLREKDEGLRTNIVKFIFPRHAKEILKNLRETKKSKIKFHFNFQAISEIIDNLQSLLKRVNSTEEEKKAYSALLLKAHIIALFYSQKPLSEEVFLSNHIKTAKENCEILAQTLDLDDSDRYLKNCGIHHKYIRDILTLIRLLKKYKDNGTYNSDKELQDIIETRYFEIFSKSIEDILNLKAKDLKDFFKTPMELEKSCKYVENLFKELSDIKKFLKTCDIFIPKKSEQLHELNQKIQTLKAEVLDIWIPRASPYFIPNNYSELTNEDYEYYQNHYRSLLLVEKHLKIFLSQDFDFSTEELDKISAFYQKIKSDIFFYEQNYLHYVSSYFYHKGLNESITATACEYFEKANTPLSLFEWSQRTKNPLLKIQLLQRAYMAFSKEQPREELNNTPRKNKNALRKKQSIPSHISKVTEALEKALCEYALLPHFNKISCESLQTKTHTAFFEDIKFNIQQFSDFSDCYYLAKLHALRLNAHINLLKQTKLEEYQRKFIEEQMLTDIKEGCIWLLRAYDCYELMGENEKRSADLHALSQFFYDQENAFFNKDSSQYPLEEKEKKKTSIKKLSSKVSLSSGRERANTDSQLSSSSTQMEPLKKDLWCTYTYFLIRKDVKSLNTLCDSDAQKALFIEERKNIKPSNLSLNTVVLKKRGKSYFLNGEPLHCIVANNQIDLISINKQIRLLQGYAYSLQVVLLKINDEIGLRAGKFISKSKNSYKRNKSLLTLKNSLESLRDNLVGSEKIIHAQDNHPQAVFLESFSSKIEKLILKVKYLLFISNVQELYGNASKEKASSLAKDLNSQLKLVDDYSSKKENLDFIDQNKQDPKSTYLMYLSAYGVLKENIALWEMLSLFKQAIHVSKMDKDESIATVLTQAQTRFEEFGDHIQDLKSRVDTFSKLNIVSSSSFTALRVRKLQDKIHKLEHLWVPFQTPVGVQASSSQQRETFDSVRLQLKSFSTATQHGKHVSMLYGTPIVVVEAGRINKNLTAQNLNKIFKLITDIQKTPHANQQHIQSLSENTAFFYNGIVNYMDNISGSMEQSSLENPENLKEIAYVLEFMTLVLLRQENVKAYIPDNCKDIPNPWESLKARKDSLCTRDAIIQLFTRTGITFPEDFLDLCSPPKFWKTKNNRKAGLFTPVRLDWEKGKKPQSWSAVSVVDKERNETHESFASSSTRVRAHTLSHLPTSSKGAK